MALSLKRLGLRRIRPLAGGIEAWQAGGFPLDAVLGEADARQPA